jgi:DNA-binding YbaB/EbfC family protein
MEFNIQNLLEQATKMQHDMEKIQDELKKKIVDAESGGGMVNVKMNGEYKLLELKISKEIVNSSDIEMLEDLIIAAVNKASKEIETVVKSNFQNMAGGLPKIPGLFNF